MTHAHRRVMRLLVLPALLLPCVAHAQPNLRSRQVTVDATWAGASVGYAVPRGPRLVGVELGVSGDFLGVMLAGGEHFTGDGDQVIELAHLAFLVRQPSAGRVTVDWGVRVAPFLHFNDLDDDPGGGVFGGAYVQPMLGSQRLRVGPRVMAGAFSEGAGRTEFGVQLSPLAVRVTF